MIAALVAIAAMYLTPAGADPAPAPAEGWEAPVLVSETQAHRETSIALSPTDPNLMFVCDPSGVPNTGYNQSYFHKSSDGGDTWSPVDVEGGQTDPRNYAFEGGDCDVAFDEAGTMYSADTWLGSLSVGHSRDGGKTWDGTSLAGTTPVVDRPWLVGGPAGTVFLSYQDLQCCMFSAIWFSKSTDYGKTFQPAVPVTTANQEGAFTWEGNLVVAPGGQDLYLVYTRRNTAGLTTVDRVAAESVWVAASHNGGLTWTSNLVARMQAPASYLYPSMAMDASGLLHVVFTSPRASDTPVWYTTSADKGVTWRAPKPIAEGLAGYSPWVAGGEAGEAAVVWYGSPDPAATGSTESDWYFYTARVTGADTATPTFTSGRTTTEPIFTGRQTVPEFEMIRLDDDGLIHIGMSAYRRVNNSIRWSIYYQREAPPPVLP